MSSNRVITVETYKDLVDDMEDSVTREFGWIWRTIVGSRFKFFWWQLLQEKTIDSLQISEMRL